jgi:phytoene dehydrogenase-like protein
MVQVSRLLSTVRPLLFTVAAILMTSACTTAPKGSFCSIASAIRPANVDVLTDAEVTQILAHNLKGQKLCNWKPKP